MAIACGMSIAGKTVSPRHFSRIVCADRLRIQEVSADIDRCDDLHLEGTTMTARATSKAFAFSLLLCGGANLNPAGAQEAVLATTPPLLVKTSEGFTVPTLDAVPSAEAVEAKISAVLSAAVQTQAMTAAECVQRAADTSVKAILLDLELSLIDQPAKKHFQKFQAKAEEKRNLKRRILHGVAQSARENAALMSLEVFYSLGAAHARLELLGKMLSELDEAIADADRREKSGLELDIPPRDLRQQRADLLKQGAALRGAIAKLNGQLESLLDLGSSSDERLIRPTIDWDVHFDDRDEDAVIANGLANNAELNLLDDLTAGMNRDNSAMLEGFLASIQPLLLLANETPSSPCKFILMLILSPKPSEREVETRRMQLQMFRSGKEREVTAKLHDAFHDMVAAEERLAFSKEEKRLAGQRLEDVEKKFQESLIGRGAVTKARMDVLRIESTIVEQITEWYIARARLQHAEGTILNCR